MTTYYGRDGQPISRDDWATAFEDSDGRRIGHTKINADVEVSTVWLGLDHSFSENGPPIIFESMVFGGPLDQEQRRYATEDEARAGHAALVEEARNA